MKAVLIAAGAVAMFAVSVSSALAELPQQPGIADLAAANQKVVTVFSDQLAKVDSPEAKSALVGELLKAAETEASPAVKYAILRKAKELAISAGDMRLTVDVIRHTVAAFAPPKENADPDKFVAKGNQLWDAAAGEPVKSAAIDDKLNAASWYLRARPTATGLDKVLIEKRLAELQQLRSEHESKIAKSVIGIWDHTVLESPIRMRMEFMPNGEIRIVRSNHDKGVRCSWKVDGNILVLAWSNGFTDRCTLDHNSRHYSGQNNSGVSFRGTRVAK